MTRYWRPRGVTCAWIVCCLSALPAAAITIKIDYTYDNAANKFFSTGNPQGASAGAQAAAALEAAAGFFTNILNDTFSSIQTPDDFVGSNGSTAEWNWEMRFKNPANNNDVAVPNPTVPLNEYRVYVGAQNLAGNTLGQGGPGGYWWERDEQGIGFTTAERNQITQIHNNFVDAVEDRGGPSQEFARWGGTIAFDRFPPAPWHYNHLTAPAANVLDFYSVAIHELAHALGFGAWSDEEVTEWEADVSGSSFYGEHAYTLHGGPVPLWTQDLAHWAPTTSSLVYGSSAAQETSMDPDLTNGTRKRFTELDAAAMKDIGWTVIPLPAVYGDYNNNGLVDAADYTIWRKKLDQNVTIPNDATPGTVRASDYTVWRANFGNTPYGGAGAALTIVPEPCGATLALVGCLAVDFARRRRRRT